MRSPQVALRLLPLYVAAPVLAVSLTLGLDPATVSAKEVMSFGLYGSLLSWLAAEIARRLSLDLQEISTKARPVHAAIRIWFMLVLVKTAISIGLGLTIHTDYLQLFLYLDIFPLLAFALLLVQHHIVATTLEKARWPLNLTLMLLMSHLFIGSVTDFMPVDFAVDPARHRIYQLVHLVVSVPTLILILRLRADTGKRLVYTAGTIWFRGVDLGQRLRPLQQKILEQCLVSETGRVSCGSLLECRESDCKASLCSRYMKAYREVADLRKRLEELGIGTLTAPENKRDVRDAGWAFQPAADVQLVINRHFSIRNPAVTDPDRSTQPPIRPRRVTGKNSTQQGLWFALLAAFVVWQEVQSIRSLSPLQAGVMVALSTGLWLLPFSAPTPARLVRYLLALGVLFPALLLALGSQASVDSILFFIIMVFTLLAMAFMLAIRNHPVTIATVRMKVAFHGVVFWILWLFLAGKLVLRSHSVLLVSFPLPLAVYQMATLLVDRLVFLGFFVLTISFTMQVPRVLTITGNEITLRGRQLRYVLSPRNRELLIRLVKAPDRLLTCDAIMRMEYPEERNLCDQHCKAMLCHAYQRLYKRMRELREALLLLDLGSIAGPPPANPARDHGWRLDLADEVCLVVAEAPAVPEET